MAPQGKPAAQLEIGDYRTRFCGLTGNPIYGLGSDGNDRDMTETESHRRAKNKAAGASGQTEVPLSGNRRLDALTAGGGRATEVERSGDPAKLEQAARRLRDSGAGQHVLVVPQNDMADAAKAMREVGIGGTVKNISGTKRRTVRPSP